MPLHRDVNLTSCHSGSDQVQSEAQWEGGKIFRFTDEKATAFNLLVMLGKESVGEDSLRGLG